MTEMPALIRTPLVSIASALLLAVAVIACGPEAATPTATPTASPNPRPPRRRPTLRRKAKSTALAVANNSVDLASNNDETLPRLIETGKVAEGDIHLHRDCESQQYRQEQRRLGRHERGQRHGDG